MRLLFLLIFSILCLSAVDAQIVQRETDFNFDWKFILKKDTIKPKLFPLKDTDWRTVRLPHDWSVENSFDSNLEGATGFLPGGVGIYQKHFKTPSIKAETNTYVMVFIIMPHFG